MELTPQYGFLEELLHHYQAPLRRESWPTFPLAAAAPTSSSSSSTTTASSTDNLFPNGCWSFDSFDNHHHPSALPSMAASIPPPPLLPPFLPFDCSFIDQQANYPFCPDGGFSIDQNSPSPLIQPNIVDEEEQVVALFSTQQNVEEEVDEEMAMRCCKPEEAAGENGDLGHLQPSMAIGFCGQKKGKSKRVEGQPSKNLMAERRRRKRLNDRLSMLRSIVPKISKMDRTSILGDTIDYMKELLESINRLQQEVKVEEVGEDGVKQVKLITTLVESRPSEALVRNSPKFSVERREAETRINVCCAPKPGLLLSTVNTIDALGLEIQQCVISCFNDFSMQASCSEGDEHRSVMSSEDIKQALFRTAGYGGRCL
ncbi:unnamed protein product [Linum trigynum]|uniref:BHLH domain-containing protein n=1 Tax=Linum trigynum TaxID=586398 RepID=A0AAV2E582_9ROSI